MSLPPVDLHDVLVARTAAFVGAVSDLDDMAVALWEGGVRMGLTVRGRAVVLKLRPRVEGEQAYATTPSTLVALELPDGGTLDRRTERVVQGLVGWIDRMDGGRLVLRKHVPDIEDAKVAPEEDGSGPADDDLAITPVVLGELAVACFADQRAALAGWGLDDTTLVLLAPDGQDADAARAARLSLVDEARAAGVARLVVAGPDVLTHPDLDVVLAAAAGLAVTVELPVCTPAAATALGGRAAEVIVRGDHTAPEVLRAARDAGLGVTAWLPATEAVVTDLPARVAALRERGAQVWLVPAAVAAEPPSANPLDLSDAADAVDLMMVGFPPCFAPSRPHLRAGAPVWRLGETGTRFGVVCQHCSARERCPGVTPDHLGRWATRGMIPILDF